MGTNEPTNVLTYFSSKLESQPTTTEDAAYIAAIPVWSPCGRDCVRIIDAAAEWMRRTGEIVGDADYDAFKMVCASTWNSVQIAVRG